MLADRESLVWLEQAILVEQIFEITPVIQYLIKHLPKSGTDSLPVKVALFNPRQF